VAAAVKQKKLNRWDDAAIRESVRHERGPFFVVSVEATQLDEVARESRRASPADIARLGFAVAHALDPAAPAVTGLTEDEQKAALRIAEALRSAEHPLVVAGAGLASAEIVQAAANVARSLKACGKDALISLVYPEANSFGASLLAAGGLDSAAGTIAGKAGATVVVAETDLLRVMDTRAASAFLGAARLISLDHTGNGTTERAEVVLPAATYAESSGTLVSSEGRAQRFFSVMPPVGTMKASWRWTEEIAVASGRKTAAWQGLDDVINALVAEFPSLKGVREAAPGADYRLNGRGIPRKSLRESGRTAVTAHIDLREPKPAADPDSPLVYTMEGSSKGAPSSLNARFWAPGWNSDQSLSRFQAEVSGQLVGGDPGTRLVEPPAAAAGGYFAAIPQARAFSGTEMLIVPRYHVFGSDELSMVAEGIASRAPQAALGMSARDAESRGLQAGQTARVAFASGMHTDMQVQIVDLPPGIASVAPGLPGQQALAFPLIASVTGDGR
jgi:NADH-quinone oxidoreductase subunit G